VLTKTEQHSRIAVNNERLEFLGDAVLELLTSEYLLSAFPQWSEGQLSKSRARLVNARSLEAAGRRLQLGEHLRLGRGEEKTGGREKADPFLRMPLKPCSPPFILDAGLAVAVKSSNALCSSRLSKKRANAWQSRTANPLFRNSSSHAVTCQQSIAW